MQWFFIALGAPFLWAIVNIADNYLVTRFSNKERERSSGGLVLFSSLIGLIISFFIFACISIAISGVIFKYVTGGNSFWISSFWEYLGLGLSGLLIFLLIPHFREAFLHMNRTGGHTIFTVNVVSEFMSVTGNLLTNFALLLAPVAMVFLVSSFQPAIVLLLAVLGTKFFPHIVKENLTKQILIPKTIAIFIMIIGSVVLFL